MNIEVNSNKPYEVCDKDLEREVNVCKRYIRRYLNYRGWLQSEDLTIDFLIDVAAIHLNVSRKSEKHYLELAIYKGIDMQRTFHAKNAVRKKLKNDPKQKALKEIQLHYDSKKNHFKRRGYSAQFVKEMGAKYPIIESIKTIERLVAKLNKINKYPVS